MTNRDLYIAIRAAVYAILDALDRYFAVGKHKTYDIMPEK